MIFTREKPHERSTFVHLDMYQETMFKALVAILMTVACWVPTDSIGFFVPKILLLFSRGRGSSCICHHFFMFLEKTCTTNPHLRSLRRGWDAESARWSNFLRWQWFIILKFTSQTYIEEQINKLNYLIKGKLIFWNSNSLHE